MHLVRHADINLVKLNALEETGQRENTYIVFTSDHGLAVGHHGLIGKQNMFEHSMKPPLILAGSGIPKGQKIETPVYMQDLMPTTLEMAGLPKPKGIEFKSLLPLATGQTKTHYPAIYGCYVNYQRMVRKGDFKLIWYPEARKYLLFNLKHDPSELEDLSGYAEYADKVKELKKELSLLQENFNDPLRGKKDSNSQPS